MCGTERPLQEKKAREAAVAAAKAAEAEVLRAQEAEAEARSKADEAAAATSNVTRMNLQLSDRLQQLQATVSRNSVSPARDRLSAGSESMLDSEVNILSQVGTVSSDNISVQVQEEEIRALRKRVVELEAQLKSVQTATPSPVSPVPVVSDSSGFDSLSPAAVKRRLACAEAQVAMLRKNVNKAEEEVRDTCAAATCMTCLLGW